MKGENSGSSIRFEQIEIERPRIDLLAGDGGPATLAAVRVIGPAQPILRAIEPYWHASYVWFPEPDRTCKSFAPRFFRKSFEVRDLNQIRSAFVQAWSNDAYTLYINGRKIVSASKEPQATAEPKTNSHQYSLSERQSVLRRDMSAMKRAPQYGLGACCWERLAISQ